MHKTLNEIIAHDDYAEIVLYKDCIEIARTKIDLEDIEKCKKYKWCLNDAGYVISMGGKERKRLRLHRFLINAPNNMVVDHINHDVLDNRKNNLRICTQHENTFNRKAKGVHYDKNRKNGLLEYFIITEPYIWVDLIILKMQ